MCVCACVRVCVCVCVCVENCLSSAKSSGLLWPVLQAAAPTGERVVWHRLEYERTRKSIPKISRIVKYKVEWRTREDVEGAGASLRAESCSFYCFLLFAGLCFVLLFY